MRRCSIVSHILVTLYFLCSHVAGLPLALEPRGHSHKIKPKVFIISMFGPEAAVWYNIPEFNVLAHNITVPGFSPLFKDAHCTFDGSVCQLTTGESEINAAVTISSLVASPQFDLKDTYFMIAGIAGINPYRGTLGSVAFSKYAVQVALQYEVDSREIPANFTGYSGYVPLGAQAPAPLQYPQHIYGTEVFEVNDALRQLAVGYAKTATLTDAATAQKFRANYDYSPANGGPAIIECDVATSDVYYAGALLSEAFNNYTLLVTNGTGDYCTTAQEDNATLEALLRAATNKLIDFSRIIVMRTASDFDRPPPGESAYFALLYADQGGFEPAVKNIYNAGIKVVTGILNDWQGTFRNGVKPSNYIGDIFGTLGGTPNFGPYPYFGSG